MSVLLIRHAHAGARADWDGHDEDRPLSERGRRQAEDLVGALAGLAPDRVLSSPFARCIETVSPLADARDLKVEAFDELGEGGGMAALRLVRSLAEESVALCTHGDVIPEILMALADEDHLDLGKHPRQAKGSVWVLDRSGGRFHRARYIPPQS